MFTKIVLFFLTFAALPAVAQDFHPAPIGHYDLLVNTRHTEMKAAYNAAHRAYVALLESKNAHTDATAALEEAMQAEGRTAESLGQLALVKANAREAEAAALAAYNTAMADHDAARQTYETVLDDDPAAEVAALQDELETANDNLAEQSAEIAALTTQLSTMTEAVCTDHAGRDGFAELCTQPEPRPTTSGN